MLNEQLELLIKKYHIDDMVQYSYKSSNIIQNRCIRMINLLIGGLALAFFLNKAMLKINNNKIAVCPGDNKNWFDLVWKMLLPQNRRKVHCFITRPGEEKIIDGYSSQKAITFQELNSQSVQAVFVLSLDSMDAANLCSVFKGKIIELRAIIYDNHLDSVFLKSGWMNFDPYSDIYIANIFRDKAENQKEKMIWHQRLIAYYLMARDFLGVQKEIGEYEKMGYADANRYSCFWKELEKLFKDIKEKLSTRKQNDVLIFWLDQIEKDDFYSMPWLGKVEGRVFQRAYTTMVNTTAVLYSILMGKNVKKGNVMKFRKRGNITPSFQDCAENRKVFISGSMLQSKGIESTCLFPCYKNLYGDAPAMIGMWYALDVLCSISDTCAIIFHCMETHNDYKTAISVSAEGNRQEKENVVIFDLYNIAKKSMEYIDSQLEWYSRLFPTNSTSIFMSDHGGNFDLSERNINIPFKIVGKDITCGDECRLFSYKNFGTLINKLMFNKKNIDNVFSKEVIIDVIDPYTQGVMQIHKEVIRDNWLFEYKSVGKDELKKYIQATKIVTDRDEYYTINILGEETYYIGTDHQHNLIGDASYTKRTAELREMAGKFYNPWKEEKQVAIEFYKYLGIEEKDILDQCY